MKKILFLIFIISISLNANVLSKVKNILGSADYNKHLNLIKYTFSNQSNFMTNEKEDYTKIASALQSKGILKLNLGTAKYINVSFLLTKNPKLSMKILKNSLKRLGYYYYFTTQSISSENSLKWSIKLKTKAAINPLRFSKILQQNSCNILNIKKEGAYTWSYIIDTNSARLSSSKNLISQNSLNLKKPLKPYLLEVANTNALNITSKSGNNWHPNIVFYDENLNIIEIFSEDTMHKTLNVEVPSDTKYIKIDDLHTLTNLKRGLMINKE